MKYQVTLIAIVLSGMATKGIAQSATHENEEFVIAYRLPENKTLHFDQPQKASEHQDAVRKLGCEVTPVGHDGHNDVTYRCPKWKSLTLTTDELAHQWEGWLEAAGFETLHGHETDHEEGHDGEHGHDHDEAGHGAEHEEVLFRLSNWVPLQPQAQLEPQELLAIAKALGCEVQQPQQSSTGTIAIRCVEWKHLELPSHEAAEYWQKWLAKAGFEAIHED